jgi:hypothetical protein
MLAGPDEAESIVDRETIEDALAVLPVRNVRC